MNTETVTVQPNGDGFEIIVQHDQTGSAYGMDLSKDAYEQLRLHFVARSLNIRNMKAGDIVTLHELAHKHFDAQFKTLNGWAIYEGIDYPNNASGWWATVSRMTPQGIRFRKMHTDTLVEIVSITK